VRVPAAVSLSLLALLLALVAPAGGRAEPGLLVGVHDDQIKWRSQPSRVLAPVRALGLDAMRVTLRWRPGRRNLTARDHHELRRIVAARDRSGVRIVLAVLGRGGDAPTTRRAREDYCRFLRNVLVRYGEIRDVVVWNEANSRTFWARPERAAARYAALLARCYDLLHGAVPAVNVVTSTAAGHDPVGFLTAVAAAYRATGRARPLFDTVGHNPYPLYPGEEPSATHDRYVGQGDHARLLAALDAAFAGTAQPQAPLWYLENGFQTAVRASRRRLYAGRESVDGAISGADQAVQLAAALRLAYCQPRVRAYFNFLLVDEPSLDRWQSGLMWADWRRKPAFAAYRAAIAEVRAGAVSCEPPPPPEPVEQSDDGLLRSAPESRRTG
jgi:hypothetical protein